MRMTRLKTEKAEKLKLQLRVNLQWFKKLKLKWKVNSQGWKQYDKNAFRRKRWVFSLALKLLTASNVKW